MGDVDVGGTALGVRQIVGNTLTVRPSHLAKRLPLSDSLLSLRDISLRLQSSASVLSNMIGLHLGKH